MIFFSNSMNLFLKSMNFFYDKSTYSSKPVFSKKNSLYLAVFRMKKKKIKREPAIERAAIASDQASGSSQRSLLGQAHASDTVGAGIASGR